MKPILVQMHGHPGSGKTTVARALGKALPAVVIDKDVIASALIGEGLARDVIGGLSYQIMYAQSARFLVDGQSVVFDSPCFWPKIEENTRRIAAETSAGWAMVECRCSDEQRDERFATRQRLPSNPESRDLGPMRPGMYHPDCERLVLDTSTTLDALVLEALAYVRSMTGPALTPGPSPDTAGEGGLKGQAVAL